MAGTGGRNQSRPHLVACGEYLLSAVQPYQAALISCAVDTAHSQSHRQTHHQTVILGRSNVGSRPMCPVEAGHGWSVGILVIGCVAILLSRTGMKRKRREAKDRQDNPVTRGKIIIIKSVTTNKLTQCAMETAFT